VVAPYHGGPVSPTQHHFALSNGALLPDGGVKFHIYLDGGTPAAPAHIMKAELTGGDNQPLETWNTETLTRLPADAIHNDFGTTSSGRPYGIVAEMGAMATVTLPPQPNRHSPAAGNTIRKLTDVNGRSFSLKLAGTSENSWVPGRQVVAVPTSSTIWHNMFFVRRCRGNIGSGVTGGCHRQVDDRTWFALNSGNAMCNRAVTLGAMALNRSAIVG
jgi:hypothetical protein